MTKISISELLQLQSTIRNEIHKTERVVRKGAFHEVVGDIETEVVAVEEHEEALGKLESLYPLAIQIADKLHEANRGTTFTHETHDGKTVELNLASALDYVKQLRSKVGIFASLGSMRPKSVVSSYGSNAQTVTTVTHDIPAYESLSETLQKEANRLSREIERQSVLAIVEMEGIEAYL
ncbi:MULTISPECIES: hypothetical protein [unclassified Exiguobacterium]|uniref:hypothetical protein n=1 Tax=unclassified Exiguobacterium TaxID=2644629 RepID=UPI001BEB44C4|nr:MULTISPECIES: hypothetical protein [unclassified Exiguobacterium]